PGVLRPGRRGAVRSRGAGRAGALAASTLDDRRHDGADRRGGAGDRLPPPDRVRRGGGALIFPAVLVPNGCYRSRSSSVLMPPAPRSLPLAPDINLFIPRFTGGVGSFCGSPA